MKCLLVDVSVVEKDGNKTCWSVFAKLGKYNSETKKIFHFNVKKDSKTPMIIQHSVDPNKNPTLYSKVSSLLPGTLVDVEYGINDYGSPVIKDIKVIKASNYTFNDLYN